MKANISAFENLQATANRSMGLQSEVAVFNGVNWSLVEIIEAKARDAAQAARNGGGTDGLFLDLYDELKSLLGSASDEDRKVILSKDGEYSRYYSGDDTQAASIVSSALAGKSADDAILSA